MPGINLHLHRCPRPCRVCGKTGALTLDSNGSVVSSIEGLGGDGGATMEPSSALPVELKRFSMLLELDLTGPVCVRVCVRACVCVCVSPQSVVCQK